jgi:hypothetical protein
MSKPSERQVPVSNILLSDLYRIKGDIFMSQRKTLLGLICIWIALETANWTLGRFLDNVATTQNLSSAAVMGRELLSLLAGPFGEGFVAGATVFSVWNIPQIRRWLKNQKTRARDKVVDIGLAEQCESISKKIYDQASLVERLRQESFWSGTSQNPEEGASKWEDARRVEAREDERFRRSVGHEVQTLLVTLQNKGIKMDLWGFSLSQHDLAGVSYFFLDVADSLRKGAYFDKTFVINSMTPRM